MLIDSKFRPNSCISPYPPYHNRYYLEEYYYNYGDNKDINNYIDIFWTNYYNNIVFGETNKYNLQEELYQKLNYSNSYYTISQHDDGVLEELPKNTLKFFAGGNYVDENTIPIPLLANGFEEYINKINFNKDKEYLCSFIGSNTHKIRQDLCNNLISLNKKDVYINNNNWDINVNNYKLINYIQKSIKSYFVLAPRGYGKTSFRLYESFSLNAIPVYISDEFYLPYGEIIDWNDFAIFIKPDEINNIYDILIDFKNSNKYSKIINNINIYSKEIFNMEYMTNYINNKIK